MKFSLIVTDSGPLITLAVANALDVMFLPGLPVIVPDMVRNEVIADLSKPGAVLVAEWMRLNSPEKLTIGPTEVFEEYMLLRSINPNTKSKNRGEQAAAEILSRELDQKESGAVLLFEDAAVRKVTYLTRLPDRVVCNPRGWWWRFEWKTDASKTHLACTKKSPTISINKSHNESWLLYIVRVNMVLMLA